MNLTRRAFVTLCVATAAGCTFVGCSGKSEAEVDGPVFDPTAFTIPPALGETYLQAKEAACQLADDAVFMGVRPAHVTEAGETVSWDYLFASHRELSYYIVFTRSGAKAARLGECTLLNTEWEALPNVESASVDADKAYEAVCEAVRETTGSVPAARNVYVYLSAYFRDYETDAAMYEYSSEPMKWYFEFNVEDESSLASTTEGADPALAEDEVANDEGLAQLPMFVYSVDALTGEVACVLG